MTGFEGENNHRISTPAGNRRPPEAEHSLLLGPGNAFQNRRVSSPAPVTIVCPSGDMARYNTLRNVDEVFKKRGKTRGWIRDRAKVR